LPETVLDITSVAEATYLIDVATVVVVTTADHDRGHPKKVVVLDLVKTKKELALMERVSESRKRASRRDDVKKPS
jgi:hypothetical protein